MKKNCLLSCLIVLINIAFAQEDLPKDYLTKEFHAGRREALRRVMPSNSVAVIFSYPPRTFSKDVDYPYHQNPDLYYFSGYKEPNAVLVMFKENQTDSDNKTYNEIFFIQKRDTLREKWTGRRLGVDGVKLKLGFDKVLEGANFKSFALNFLKFGKIIFDELPADIKDDPRDSADLYNLIENFKQKINLPEDYDNAIKQTLSEIKKFANPTNMSAFIGYVKAMVNNSGKFKKHAVINKFINLKDSIELKEFINELKTADTSKLEELNSMVASLREIKTAEEMKLMRKSIDISSVAHAEVMKAVKPGMSETEVQGLQEYVHKKYGAEYVGYPSIVGAGENGCILHYEENSRTKLGNNLLLMDVGAEYHGYSADVTRTIPANGKFSKEQKVIYDLVYEAQEEIFKLCKEGTPFDNLNNKAKEVLGDGLLKLGIIKDKKDLGTYYPHGCSHHLGLDVHDKSNYDTLKANMVITVEPGIYIAANSPCDKKWWSIGVRIEDDVLIGKEKCELLSSLAPRKSEEIEKKIAEKSAVDDFVLPGL
ncbi:MAG: aminopeptidase P family protein [Ginsengibacter sp.]